MYLNSFWFVLQDANGLYLHCMSQKMPIGFYYRRQAPNFELVQGGKGRQSSFSAYCWLTWKEIELKTNIVHEFSNGGEFRVGAKKLPVDGYSEELNRVFEFQGKFYNKKIIIVYTSIALIH